MPCLGVHPVQGHDPACPRGAVLEDLESALPLIEKYKEHIVAIGEVGLDFTPRVVSSDAGKESQRQVLIRQAEIAKHLSLPLNVHSRSAGRPTIHLLKELGVENALLHAFDGKPSVAMEGVRAGYYFSIPPSIVRSEQVILNFYNTTELKCILFAMCAFSDPSVMQQMKYFLNVFVPTDVFGICLSYSTKKQKLVKQLPLENLCLETDSPALGPEKQVRNEPRNITISAEYISKTKGIPLEKVVEVTTHNALRLFPKLKAFIKV
ncbi:putative deoxyribonuclease TATDN3 isoform X4 [Brachyhypopomus gauderio]